MEEEKHEAQSLGFLNRRYPLAQMCLSLRNHLNARQLASLLDMNKMYNSDLYLELEDQLKEIEEDPYVSTFEQLLVKLDTEQALKLNNNANDGG